MNKIKIVTVVGARPQFIKASAISRAIDKHPRITEVTVHTGQHYDANMSAVFFEELQMSPPRYHFNTKPEHHGKQTAEILMNTEEVILKERPQAVLVYGDTNSTLAGGLAAAKLQVPLVHVEAGLRSFNKSMPEEVNRIVCDHLSTLLFCPTQQGVDNLAREGFQLENAPPYTVDRPKVYHCGDIMYDNVLYFSALSEERSTLISTLQLERPWVLCTVHRSANTDDPKRLSAIFRALLTLAEEQGKTVVLPLHPRTRKKMEAQLDASLKSKITSSRALRLLPPVSFFDMIALEKQCHLVITDSGGVQKEAFFFKKPCIVLREETEWTEIVKHGNALLAGTDEQRILQAYKALIDRGKVDYPPLFGDGKSAEFIVDELVKHLG